MAIQVTNPIKVRKVLEGSSPVRTITFWFTTPFQPLLYLSILALLEGPPPTSGFAGTLNPGSPTMPGNGTIHAAHGTFDPLWNFALNNSQVSLIITYDDSDFAVTGIQIITTPALLSVGP